MRNVWILRLLILVASTISRTFGSSCEVSSIQNRYVLSCKDRDLETVPNLTNYDKSTPYDELTLANNRIQRIEDGAFGTLRMKLLDLTGNPIVSVSPLAFQGLRDILVDLLISFDQTISEFQPDFIQQIPGIRSLAVQTHGFRTLTKDTLKLKDLGSLQSLAFREGYLDSLDVGTFENQVELSMLDLYSNQLSTIPTAALSKARGLKILKLGRNRITSLTSGSFRGLVLEVLDLSTQIFQISIVDESAFAGLENTLKNLTMSNMHLTGQHLRALKPLVSLIDLDLSQNKITNIDGLFTTLTLLQKLNLQDNPITALTSSALQNAKSLRILNLASNSITSMDQDAFVGLTALEDLDLGNSKGITLTENTFMAQRKTLKFLKLQNSNLLASQWSSIAALNELHDLFLSGCNLSNIPDFTFRSMKKLRSIDLKNNRIDMLTQRSLAGLENSLEILNLYGNRIQTIDHCVFRDFARINIFQLNLQQNPLQCDCGLQWLYNATNIDSNKKKRLTWFCSNLNINFKDLDDSNFVDCDASTSQPPCEDWASPTTNTRSPITVQDSTIVTTEILSFRIVNASSDSITVQWAISTNETSGFSLTCEPTAGGDRRYVALDNNAWIYQIAGLSSEVSYKVCLEVKPSDVVSCLNATTSSTGLNLILVYCLSIAGGVAIIVLLVIIVCCCCCVTSTPHVVEHPAIADEPKLGNNTKRFQKPQATNSDPLSKSIAEHLEKMSEMERYQLLNLLTHSGGSMASMDYSERSLPRQRLQQGYVVGSNMSCTLPPGYSERYHPVPQSHQYDYIADDEFYDEISDDDIV